MQIKRNELHDEHTTHDPSFPSRPHIAFPFLFSFGLRIEFYALCTLRCSFSCQKKMRVIMPLSQCCECRFLFGSLFYFFLSFFFFFGGHLQDVRLPAAGFCVTGACGKCLKCCTYCCINNKAKRQRRALRNPKKNRQCQQHIEITTRQELVERARLEATLYIAFALYTQSSRSRRLCISSV